MRLSIIALLLALAVAGPVGAQSYNPNTGMSTSASNASLPSAWNALSLSPGQASVPRLNRWRAALARIGAATGRGTLLVLGASQSAGGGSGTGGPTLYNGAYPLVWPAVLATMLNGFVSTLDNSLFSDQNVVSKGVTYELYDTRSGALPTGWTWGPSTQSIGGFALQYNNSGVNPFAFTPVSAFDTITLYYVQKAGQGSFATNVDGGASLGTTNTATGVRSIGSATFTVAKSTHTINLVPINDGQVVIMGIKTYDSTTPGIDVIRGARAGGSASNFITTTNPWDSLNTIGTLKPDLTLIFLDKNDAANGVAIATMMANLQTIITEAQQSGDVIIGTESPSATSVVAYATQLQYVQAVISLAQTNNIPYVSIFDRWVSYENLNDFHQAGTPTLQAGGSSYTISQTSVDFTVLGGTCATPIHVLGNTNGSGVVTGINGLSNAGDCTTFPTSPAQIQIGTTGASNATVNITAGQLMAYGDTQHPSKVGYRDWAQAVFDVVRSP